MQLDNRTIAPRTNCLIEVDNDKRPRDLAVS